MKIELTTRLLDDNGELRHFDIVEISDEEIQQVMMGRATIEIDFDRAIREAVMAAFDKIRKTYWGEGKNEPG